MMKVRQFIHFLQFLLLQHHTLGQTDSNQTLELSQNDTAQLDDIVNITTAANDTVNISTAENDTVNISSAANDTVNISTAENDTVNISAAENDTVNISSAANDTVNITTAENDTANITTAENDTVNITTAENITFNIITAANTTDEGLSWYKFIPKSIDNLLWRIGFRGYQDSQQNPNTVNSHIWMNRPECFPLALQSQKRYICNTVGELICLDGWSGEDCSLPLCRMGCGRFGKCVEPEKCRCQVGYHGEQCEKCVTFPGCVHGTCKTAYECSCLEGWKGSTCSEPICKPECKTNAICKYPGVCECIPGMTGKTCEKCIRAPGCLHGTCTTPFQCLCLAGWSGASCDRPTCSGGCGHGTCRKPNQCKCREGWRGERCNRCSELPGCQHGTCSKPGECNCKQGYYGTYCNSRYPVPDLNRVENSYGENNEKYFDSINAEDNHYWNSFTDGFSTPSSRYDTDEDDEYSNDGNDSNGHKLFDEDGNYIGYSFNIDNNKINGTEANTNVSNYIHNSNENRHLMQFENEDNIFVDEEIQDFRGALHSNGNKDFSKVLNNNDENEENHNFLVFTDHKFKSEIITEKNHNSLEPFDNTSTNDNKAEEVHKPFDNTHKNTDKDDENHNSLEPVNNESKKNYEDQEPLDSAPKNNDKDEDDHNSLEPLKIADKKNDKDEKNHNSVEFLDMESISDNFTPSLNNNPTISDELYLDNLKSFKGIESNREEVSNLDEVPTDSSVIRKDSIMENPTIGLPLENEQRPTAIKKSSANIATTIKTTNISSKESGIENHTMGLPLEKEQRPNTSKEAFENLATASRTTNADIIASEVNKESESKQTGGGEKSATKVATTLLDDTTDSFTDGQFADYYYEDWYGTTANH